MKLTIKELVTFSMLSAIMLISKLLLEAIPNFHLLAVFTVAITVVYRKKALYPIYLYVILQGVVAGFNPWWVPHLYLWTVLWGAVMLLPKNMPKGIAAVVYTAVCGLHGFSYGMLYAPTQALFFGLDLEGMITWWVAGLPFDVVHGVHNLLLGLLIMPIISALKKADQISRN
jgi:hypothetical protein